jgi:hypothetical protein
LDQQRLARQIVHAPIEALFWWHQKLIGRYLGAANSESASRLTGK